MQVGELDGEVVQVRAVADVPSLRASLAQLEAEASAGDLWDDPSKAAAVMEAMGNTKEEIAAAEALAAQLEDVKLGLELLEMEVTIHSTSSSSVFTRNSTQERNWDCAIREKSRQRRRWLARGRDTRLKLLEWRRVQKCSHL